MFERIKLFFSGLWQKIKTFVTSFFKAQPIFTDKDKYDFVVYLLKGQNQDRGFALRHVSDDKTKNSNIEHGCFGDAVSYSITPLIMSQVLKEKIDSGSWHIDNDERVSFIDYDMDKPIILDQELAVKIFDCIHEKILQFIQLNFLEGIHHYMVVKNMVGATNPYDIKEIYPTGKCGKRTIEASQFIKVFSKNDWTSTPEEMLGEIETGMLQLARSKHYEYNQGSTVAILQVLREINFNANDKVLKLEDVRKRLINAEYQTSWSDNKYHQFHDQGGYLEQFTQTISHVNEDLDHFRALM